jgi:hypothetical protein
MAVKAQWRKLNSTREGSNGTKKILYEVRQNQPPWCASMSVRNWERTVADATFTYEYVSVAHLDFLSGVIHFKYEVGVPYRILAQIS